MNLPFYVFLLLLSLICFSDSLVNKKVGAEEEQNKNDPKYQKMAKELIHSYLHIKDKDLQNVTVNKVTTQMVSGTVTILELRVSLVNGKSSKCQFKILEQKWKAVKYVSYKCDSLFSTKKLSSLKLTRPHPKISRDPKNPKYKKIAKLSLDTFFKTPGHKPFKKEDIKKIFVTNAKVQINSKIETVVIFRVITVKDEHFKCTSGVAEKPWSEQQSEKVNHINCTIHDGKSESEPDGLVPQNPNDPKYNQLAKKSFETYQQTNGFIQYKYLKVTKVSTQEVIGVITRIDFIVFPNKGESFSCHSEISEKNRINHKVTCDKQKRQPIPGDEIPDNLGSYYYKNLAKESFEKFQETNGIIKVKDLKVNKVVAGIVTQIYFTVIPKKGSSFPCQSEILVRKKVFHKNIKVTCKKEEHHHEFGHEIFQNPDNPKYKNLAIESFERYQKNNGFVDIKELKVTKVTTQVVSGTITRIDFNVIATNGQSYPCHSEILEKISFRHKNIKITCEKQDNAPIPGAEVPQNPDKPEYKQLANEAFKEYQVTYGTIMIKNLKVTKVTTQVVSGVSTRIDFNVISTDGQSFSCNSEILEKGWVPSKNIKITCEKQDNAPIPGGEVPQNPDNPEYKQKAEEAFKKFQETYGTLMIKELKVTKVITQVVSGVSTRIDFTVFSTEGQSFSCHSEILEKGWVPSKNIKITCDKKDNATIPGGEVPQNPDKPEYKQLANEAFEKFQETYGTIMIKNLKVTRVTTQVVSGVSTRIDFTVISTEGQSFSCHSEISQKKWVPSKTMKITCDKQDNAPIPGGEVPQNPEKPEYKQLANEAFEKFQETYGTIIIKNLKVTKVTTQVVFGVRTRIDFTVISTEGQSFSCHSEILEKGWVPSKNIKITCEKQDNAPITGGEVPQNPDNPEYKQKAERAFKKFQETYGTVMIKELKVTKVITQVLSGASTRIDFTVFSTEGQSFSCHSEILEKGWVPSKNIKITCDKKDNASIPGGEVPQNPDKPGYKQLANEAFEKFQETYGTIMIKNLKVTRVTTQVIVGLRTRIDFTVLSTKNQLFTCNSQIIEEKFTKDIKIICTTKENPPTSDDKILQNPSDPKYLELAKESFKIFQEDCWCPFFRVKRHKVTRVIEKQVASNKGSHTKIYFDVILNNGKSFRCQSDILEDSWPVNAKFIVPNCKVYNQPKNMGPGGKIDTNFEIIAEQAIKRHLDSFLDFKLTKMKRIEIKDVSSIQTRMSKANIIYIHLQAFTESVSGNHLLYDCSVVSEAGYERNPIFTDCLQQDKNVLMPKRLRDPSDEKYLAFAEQSIQKFSEISKNNGDRSKYDIIVTFVVTIDSKTSREFQIKFVVRVLNGPEYKCSSNVTQKFSNRFSINRISDVKCRG